MTDIRAIGRIAVVILLAALPVGCSKAPAPLFSGTVNVGAAPSSPGWGTQDSAGRRDGFDYDLTNWLGQHLKFTPAPITVISANREDKIEKHVVSMVVATYSITDKRRERVGFAGPYMLGRQGVMVRTADRDEYGSLDDLKGKSVCATTGSTSIDQLKTLGFPVSIVSEDVYDQCRADLLAHRVDALSTDQLLLYGLANLDHQLYVPPDITFGNQERYGVGLVRGDKARCEAVTAELKAFIADGFWDAFFAKNLPGVPAGQHRPDPNELDAC